jgi:4-methylaminobutanoate oxidase (formaldehyde-forming)
MGGYERHCAPWSLDGVPADFNGKLLEEDWPRFEELMQNAIVRVPSVEGMGVVRLINGPEAFTPDGEFILGPSDVRGFWVAAGFCAHGLAGAGGMGQLVAEWVVEGTPSLDVWHMDSRRFGAAYRSREHTLARTKEIYETYYDVRYPGHERSAGRPLRVSPAYDRLVRLGAAFGEKSGWERANWFEPNAAVGDEALRPRGWAGKLWSPAIGVEHRACREAVAIFDESSFAKIDVTGAAAAAFLESLCANRVAREVGTVTYTQKLNPRGGTECDFTVTRLGVERFRIVTGTAFGQHDLAWLREHAPRDGSVTVADVTSALACFGVWGPHARALLQPLTTTDLSNEAFSYMRAGELAVGPVPCVAVRVTYVGELGWELYCPAEYGGRLWDVLWDAGEEHGLVAGGYKAIDSLRLEKGYRVWGADITPEDSPLAAGLGFAVKLDKSDFVGRDALLATEGPEHVLRCLTLEDPRAVALGSEPVRVGDRLVGRVTSGGYGYTVERSIAYAYLPAADAEVGTRVAVEIFGDWVGGEVAAEPLYDPAGARVRS